MTTQPERPTTLPPRRSRPQPAADENRDPVQPQPAVPAAPAPAVTRRRQAAVQLSVRIPADLADHVADEAMARGVSQRQLVEDALRAHLARG